MKRTDLIPALLLMPVLGFIAVQAMHTRAIPASSQAASIAPAARGHNHGEATARTRGNSAATADGGAAPNAAVSLT